MFGGYYKKFGREAISLPRLMVIFFYKLRFCTDRLFLDFRLILFIQFIENEVGEDHGADTCGEFTDDNGNEVIGVEGDSEREMSREDERTGNGKRHIEDDTLFVHLLSHADRSHIGRETGDQTHGGDIVDTDELAEKDQGLFQNLGENVNEGERTRHNGTGIDDGSHAFVVEGSHAGKKHDSRELGEKTDGKSEGDEDLHALTEDREDLYTAVRRKSESRCDDTGEDDEGNEVHGEISKAHFQNDTGDQTSDGDGDDTAEHTERNLLVVLFIDDTECERDREGDRSTEHGADDQTVEVSRNGVACHLLRKRSTAHIVGKQGTHNDGRFQMQIFLQRIEYRHDQIRDHGCKHDHTDHGKRHGTEKHNAFLHFLADTETVAENTVRGRKQHEAGKNKV